MNILNRGFISKLAILGAGLLLPCISFAKEGDDKLDLTSVMPSANEANILMPNLTVNFSLNSVLGAEETAYYAKIVEKLLKNLPKKITLTGEESALLSGSKRYDELNVIAYFPADGEVVSDNPLNKKVKKFKVEFELPRVSKLKRLSEKGGNSAIKAPKVDFDKFMSGGDNTSDNKNSMASEDVSASAKMPVKVLPPVEDKKIAVNKKEKDITVNKQVIKNIHKPKKIVIKYFDDTVKPKFKGDLSLEKLAKLIVTSGSKNIKIVSKTESSPFIAWKSVRKSRIDYLQKSLLKYNLDMSKYNISFINLKGFGEQYISLEF